MKDVVVIVSVLFLLLVSAEIASSQINYLGEPGPDTAGIWSGAIEMPLGWIFLIRNGSDYCAVKFTYFSWPQTKDNYAEYDCYYQKDGTGDFFNKNAQFSKGKAISKIRGFWGWGFEFGDPVIYCGPTKLGWGWKGVVGFGGLRQEPGDYGIELAPTKWKEFSQVNVSDPRIKWYKFQGSRKTMFIPLGELWEENQKVK
jgi:hypothetical protein